MRLSTFVLFVALFALLGLCVVHEETSRVRVGYEMGRMLAERERLSAELADAEAELALLVAPERLARLNEELALGLGPRPGAVVSPEASARADDPHRR